ncbi:hypothetical protein [Nonomuraea sp. NPDC003201]
MTVHKRSGHRAGPPRAPQRADRRQREVGAAGDVLPGLRAQVLRHLSAADLPDLLDDGHLVMAAVHQEIRRPAEPAPGPGGYLSCSPATTTASST